MSSKRKSLLFIVSAPAGTGKTTLINRLCQTIPHVTESISCTTRPKRSTEIEGEHYHFIDDKEFDQRIAQGDFLEWVHLFGYRYGTSREFVQQALQQGNHVVLVIDTQGAAQILRHLACPSIFISPPNLEALRERLHGRRTESQESLEVRLAKASEELSQATFYDYQLVNDDIDRAYEILKSIIIAEEHRNDREIPNL